MMSKKQNELEGRLDEMLNRIAKETQEIKDLEQQLTEGKRHCSHIILVLEAMLRRRFYGMDCAASFVSLLQSVKNAQPLK